MSHYPKYATIMMSNSLATKMFLVDDKDYSNKSWAVFKDLLLQTADFL